MATDPNIVQLVAVPQPLGTVPAPATGAPRTSAGMQAMAQALLNYIAGGIYAATPIGAVMAFAGSSAPTGWLLCDGRAVSRSTYAGLYTVLGTQYGAGDGSTTFNLPDLRGRAVVGAGQGTNLTNRTIGAAGGEEAHSLTIGEMPAHNHQSPTPTNINAAATPGNSGYELPPPVGVSAYTNYDYIGAAPTSNTGGNGAHNNMQPYLALNYIVRY